MSKKKRKHQPTSSELLLVAPRIDPGAVVQAIDGMPAIVRDQVLAQEAMMRQFYADNRAPEPLTPERIATAVVDELEGRGYLPLTKGSDQP